MNLFHLFKSLHDDGEILGGDLSFRIPVTFAAITVAYSEIVGFDPHTLERV